MMYRMSRKRQVSIPLRREHEVHLESFASLYAVARQNFSCICIRSPGSEYAGRRCKRSPHGHVQPHAASDLRGESIESDLIRFEEDVSPAPRAAECARFLLLLLPAGIVGGRGERGCVMGTEGRRTRGHRRRFTAELAARVSVHVPRISLWVRLNAVLWTTTIKSIFTKQTRLRKGADWLQELPHRI